MHHCLTSVVFSNHSVFHHHFCTQLSDFSYVFLVMFTNFSGIPQFIKISIGIMNTIECCYNVGVVDFDRSLEI